MTDIADLSFDNTDMNDYQIDDIIKISQSEYYYDDYERDDNGDYICLD